MRKNKNQIWRFLYKLHRYLGLSSAIVLLMLSLTGIALNHTDDLKLDSQMVDSKVILDWYGIKPSETLNSFATQNHWITQINQKIFFDHSVLNKNKQNLLGAIETEEFIVTGFSNSILLLSLEGELIEESIIKSIEKIGLDTQKNITIKSSEGIVYSDDGLLSWQPYDDINNQTIIWSKTSRLPDTLAEKLKTLSRSSILPLERVILDLHSGRFFGSFGVFIVDLSGIFLIVLSLSGCAIWLKHKFRNLRRNKKSS
ncbi:MAG: PepSY-associated TM helix domain-containing protein [Methylococcaceae bacterium]